eukprot:8545433-Lingulodinium_polyedra.AAC.1
MAPSRSPCRAPTVEEATGSSGPKGPLGGAPCGCTCDQVAVCQSAMACAAAGSRPPSRTLGPLSE